MTSVKQNSELLPVRRGGPGSIFDYPGYFRVASRGRRFGRFIKMRFSYSVFVLAALVLIYFAPCGFKASFHVTQEAQQGSSNVVKPPDCKSNLLVLSNVILIDHILFLLLVLCYPSCKIDFLESVNDLVEPKDFTDFRNFTKFSLEYIDKEYVSFGTNMYKPRFGGHQTLQEREESFYAKNHTLHCGFVNAPGFSSTGFDLDEKDKKFMSTCKIVVYSAIFGSFDFLRKPAKNKISDFSLENICFVLFVDENSLSTLSSEGNNPDDRGYIDVWRIVIVGNLPFDNMPKNPKVAKFLGHRLFPSARYSIWIDMKVRLEADPMLMIERFLWKTRSEYAISNHYVRYCLWEEVARNVFLKKVTATAANEQLKAYQSDGLTKFDPSNPNNLLPSYNPESCLIIRAHTPMSNLYSCVWFNEVVRFTNRDQLSYAYAYVKLRRMNPNSPFYLHMFKDCERRTMAKPLGHRLPHAVVQ
ncbi:hypothetical protein Ddye_014811 [Dipteronia dyeriana]|uniref:TOD1/MUCI70 glycosyltransferase-like domain-containing protein n=1 Tax=Dipteronia dyeriana TaxID=168575 RepID=A0AAD9U440_9ROSI|nr:hypothetical protein Ddye_014811 [Dipteronia dyeriana]